MKLNEKIKRQRLALGLTQKQLAELTGYETKSAITQIEAGYRDVSRDHMAALSAVLNIPLREFLPTTAGTVLDAQPVPVYSCVHAGGPSEAVDTITGYVDFKPESADAEYFALTVRGASMEPRIYDGDVLICRRQPDAETGDVVIALVGGDGSNEATVKKLIKSPGGIILQPNNPDFAPIYGTGDNVQIIGVVVELRRRKGGKL